MTGLIGCELLSIDECLLHWYSDAGLSWFLFWGADGPACGCECGGRERIKSARWMPWRQEAMKDVARCDKLRGDASDR